MSVFGQTQFDKLWGPTNQSVTPPLISLTPQNQSIQGIGGKTQPSTSQKTNFTPTGKNSSLVNTLGNFATGLKNFSTSLSGLKPNATSVNGLAIKPPPTPPETHNTDDVASGLQAQFDSLKKSLNEQYQTQIDELKNQIQTTQQKNQNAQQNEENALNKYGQVANHPTANVVTNGINRYQVNKNYFENQSLLGDLERIMNEMNTSTLRDSELLASGAISKRDLQRRKDWLTARAGTLQAVLNARNNQIGTALNIIDRTYNAIKADKQSQIDYYKNLANYYDSLRNQTHDDIFKLDKTQRDYINKQIKLNEIDVDNMNKSVNYIKDLMLNPKTAKEVYDAGVTFTDSVDDINKKLAKVGYQNEVQKITQELLAKGYSEILPSEKNNYPSYEIVSWTDSRNKVHYYALTQGGLNNPLTPYEAKSWNVPYGTTRGQIVGRTASKTSGQNLNKVLSPHDFLEYHQISNDVLPTDTYSQAQEKADFAIKNPRDDVAQVAKKAIEYKKAGKSYAQFLYDTVSSVRNAQGIDLMKQTDEDGNRLTAEQALKEIKPDYYRVIQAVYGDEMQQKQKENSRTYRFFNWLKGIARRNTSPSTSTTTTTTTTKPQ